MTLHTCCAGELPTTETKLDGAARLVKGTQSTAHTLVCVGKSLQYSDQVAHFESPTLERVGGLNAYVGCFDGDLVPRALRFILLFVQNVVGCLDGDLVPRALHIGLTHMKTLSGGASRLNLRKRLAL